MGRKLIVRLEHDQDTERPESGYDGWKLVSFGRRHSNYEDPDNYVKSYDGTDVTPANIGLRRKLQVGLAFYLSYYEHGQGAWSLIGGGVQDRWDTARLAGILLWTGKPGDIGAKTYDDREKDAEGFLGEYNDWMNGVCYYYSVETVDGEDVESVGGFIGEDSVNEALADVLEPGDVVKVEGEADYAFEAPEGVEVVDEHEEDEEPTVNVRGLLSVTEDKDRKNGLYGPEYDGELF